HNFPWPITATGAAGNLRQQLERSLGSAEIGQREGGIGTQDRDQRDLGEIMPLRDHLRADENVDIARAKSAKHALVIANMPHGIAVDAAHARVREKMLQFGLQTLCSLSYEINVLAIALRTPRVRAA